MEDDWGSIARRCGGVLEHVEAARAGLPLDAAEAPAWLQEALGRPKDLVVRTAGDATILYLSTIVDHPRVEDAIVRPLTLAAEARSPMTTFADAASEVRTYGEALHAILAAHAVVVLRGRRCGFALAVPKWPQRDITEPAAEFLARGPHTGFVENLDTNIALVRHGIRDARLRWEEIDTGGRSGTHGAMLYVEGMVRRDLLARVRRHIQLARPSYTLDGAMLGQWLAPRSNRLFPTVGTTERPDRTIAALLEGRIAVLVSGSPTALLIPNLFAHMLHVPEDYYQVPIFALANRLVRVAGLLVASGASPVLVALTTVNHDLIPERLFVAIAQSRRGVPIPIAIEVLILELLIEIIREAGVRLPGPVGQSVAILGAVIVGQAAVMAGLISAPAVVVVSLAYIASFVLPSSDLVMTLRLMRYPLIVLAAFLGLYGVTWGLLLALMYVCSLDSFGVPYLAPLTPLRRRGLQDTLWRRPLPHLRRSFVSARPVRGRAR